MSSLSARRHRSTTLAPRTPAIRSLVTAAAFAASAVSVAHAITIPTVPIGNPGNTPDPTTGFGSVAYTYNIGQTEVTNAQYAAFLNAVAASDPFGLYNTSMPGSTRTGTPGQYTYSTASGREHYPVTFVSFWDACRFANWLHNGQGSGDTETGAYTLGGIANPINTSVTRNAGWQWAVASENEWYKAAYHQPAAAGGDADNYWLYPTSSNTINTSQANYISVIGGITPVGSYAANYYATFDMGGNVWEWNDTAIGTARGHLGGSFADSELSLRAEGRNGSHPTFEDDTVGFRVVQIPGPSSFALLAIGRLAATRRRRS